MAPVHSTKFETANFPIFCARIIVIFCTTCIAREMFSLVKVLLNEYMIYDMITFEKFSLVDSDHPGFIYDFMQSLV